MADLDDKQLGALRGRLDDRERELQEQVRSARDEADAAADPTTEVDDQAAAGEALFRSGLEHVQLQRDQEELQAIDAARARMSGGAYGECADCGLGIPFERLEAQPVALRCIACQSIWENSHDATPRYLT